MTEQKVNISIDKSEFEFARRMLTQVAYVRAFEAKALSLTQTSPPRVLGSMHFCAGQEVVPLAAVAALRDDDQILATYRGHGWALAAGLTPKSVMGEICHKAVGINGGRGGSAYIMAPHTRFIGENSIVGAGTTAACGVAMANLAQNNQRVVVVSIGDGALNQGSVHEAFAFAAARSLPVIFTVENNGWSELTPTGDMFRIDRLGRRAIGYGFHSVTIDGTDPFTVRDAFRQAAATAREGRGPILIECKVPRLWGHYHRDIEHYRSKSDKQAAEAIDPLLQLSRQVVAAGIMTKSEVDKIIADQLADVEAMTEEIMASSDPDPSTARDHVTSPANASDQVVAGETCEMSYIDAVRAALRAELSADPRTIVYGEDVGKPGGIFGGSRNLQREFGANRVFDTPIAENAILGSAVGAAMSGMKPIVEIMWADFLMVAFDQLVNQASNVSYLTRGRNTVPMTVRMQQGATPGSCAQHSQSLEALIAHVPGLKVALASSPQDAYSLIRTAAADPDPCIVIEARSMFADTGPVLLGQGVEPVGRARLRREGDDVGVITWGTMVPRALSAAADLAADGIDAAVLDLRWLNPIDQTALAKFVRNVGGRVLILHEAVQTGGFAGEVAFQLNEMNLGIPLIVRRLATPDVRIPASPVLQAALVPGRDSIAAALRDIVSATSANA